MTTVNIATWNVNSIKVRMPHVAKWLTENAPDVLCLQETKSQDENFPQQAFSDLGYHVVYIGQKTYNGVAIVSREPATDVINALPGMNDEQRRFLAATIGGIRIIDVYTPNGQALDSDKYPYKLQWLEQLTDYLKQQLAQYDKLVVLGDYNIAPADEDVHDPKAWEGHVLVSDAERAAFQKLLDTGLSDTFRLFEQEEGVYSWWDYRAAGFRRNHGLRIDHILASAALRQCCISCHIDKAPRKWERPSDHAPVVARFDL